MTMTLVHMTELLQEATELFDRATFDRATKEPAVAFPLAVGAGAVDPELIKPRSGPADIEEVIAFRCSSL